MATQYGTDPNYSAGYCIPPNYSAGDYTDWYLPSVCEMGYGGSDTNFDCSTTSSPDYVPNIQVNLLQDNPSQSFNFTSDGFYWSSTASEQNAPSFAWGQKFVVGGGIGSQTNFPLFLLMGVRCARAITN